MGLIQQPSLMYDDIIDALRRRATSEALVAARELVAARLTPVAVRLGYPQD